MTSEMVPTEINGRWTLALPDFRAELPEWTDPGWERERLDSMYANLRPGMVLYDVGTEQGDLSGLFARWVAGSIVAGNEYIREGARMREPDRWIPEGDGGIILVEPNERVWPVIRAVWEANLLPPPIAWWQGFASNCDGYKPPHAGLSDAETFGFGDRWPLSACDPIRRGHSFRSHAENGYHYPNIRLDNLVHRVGRAPDAITIDVEGAEMLVLEGAAAVLDRDRPLVWVSIHDEMIRYDYHYTSESVHQYMKLHGYRMQLLAIDHESHWVYWPQECKDVVLP